MHIDQDQSHITLIEQVTAALTEQFAPTMLQVEDDSADHLGHGAPGAHLHVIISAPALRLCSRIEAHRKIYDALKPWLLQEIHALRITIQA